MNTVAKTAPTTTYGVTGRTSIGYSEQRCAFRACVVSASVITLIVCDASVADGIWYRWRRVFECDAISVWI